LITPIYFISTLKSVYVELAILIKKNLDDFGGDLKKVHGLNYDKLLLSIVEESSFPSNKELSFINNSNTFFTKGFLSTVLYPDLNNLREKMPNQQQYQNRTVRTTTIYQYPKLVSGTWSLNVSNGLAKDFHAEFKLVDTNGLEKHFIKILNFRNAEDSSVKFHQFSNTNINGFADIKIDKEIFQRDFPLTIQIFRINTIVLDIKEEIVGNIFYNNNFLGITDSFKNFRNKELLILDEIND
jgi:hypothetical protein